jgi:hypothetical protein
MNDIHLPYVRRGNPITIHYGNPSWTYFGVMLFPDDPVLARRFVARLLHHHGRMQGGHVVDLQYMNQFVDDLGYGEPDNKLIQRRRRWASNVGQIIIALLAMIDDPDPHVRERASIREAVEQIEKAAAAEPPQADKQGRPRLRRDRGTRSGFHRPLDALRRSLHMAAAWEMAGDKQQRFRPPRSIDGMMLNAMTVYERLHAWDSNRPPKDRSTYLAAPPWWAWQNMAYDGSHGTPMLALGFDQLSQLGTPGRPWPKK